jgi:hypothetical protein
VRSMAPSATLLPLLGIILQFVARYLQCMNAGYNEWLLSVSLGQVPSLPSLPRWSLFLGIHPHPSMRVQVFPAGSMLDHEVRHVFFGLACLLFDFCECSLMMCDV